MRCRSCSCENEEEAQFCEECGTPLVRTCPSCGREVRPAARFCSTCGTALTTQASPAALLQPDQPPAHLAAPAPPLTERVAPQAERRQLTVMFCDLVGSTRLSEQLDPEEWRTIVRAYQETCASVIQRFEGHIAQYLGDGLLVYFGYPLAHEDDARRAVRTGLEIIQTLQSRAGQQAVGVALPDSRGSDALQVRVGIHTGLVVVGDIGTGGRSEQLALGETPNIAARMQEIATPDSVVISAATQRLVQGLFECQDLGSRPLKGVSTPMSVYRVLGESGVQSRFEVAVTTGLTPLVGREQEVGLLLERWERAKEGEGQVVLLSGEAGVGKSRLVQTLKERAATESHTRLECRCSPYYQNSALYPVIDLLQRLLQFKRDDTPEAKLTKLEGALEPYGFALPEVVPLFASLLFLSLSERYPPLTLTPQKQKEKTQQAVLAWLLKEAERQPVRFVVEDLHWADPSTLELLGLFIDQAPTACLLIVLTFRPDFTSPWAPRSHLTSLTLSPLLRKQVEVMIEKVAGGKALPAEVIQQVITKTDGVPLFVEELTKTVLESGLLREAEGRYELTGPLPPLAIPTTLQDSLMARLDRLATVREVAQLGATLGREFPYELIQAVSPVEEAKLQEALAKLVEAEVLYQRGFPPQAAYLFKHALIQDAAYQSLLKSKRQQYHQQIARVLEERFAETREIHPELLGHHYTEAGLRERAIVYWQRAGQRAIERSANTEAIGHLLKGLELLRTLPDTPERWQQELAYQTMLASAFRVTKGYGAEETLQTLLRAQELCRQLGAPQLSVVQMGLMGVYFVRGEFHTTQTLGEQLLETAQREHDSTALLGSHMLLGITLLTLGKLTAAHTHLAQGLALYEPQQHTTLTILFGQDFGVSCCAYDAYVLWLYGYPDQALTYARAALTRARELAHPFSEAVALIWATLVYSERGDGHTVQEWSEEAFRLASAHGFPEWQIISTAMRGQALVLQGQYGEGQRQLQQSFADLHGRGFQQGWMRHAYWIAEAYKQGGQPEEGLRMIAEALTMMQHIEERFYEAELYRLKGELLLAGERRRRKTVNRKLLAEAEECFLKAIEVAGHQSAKSLELRAVMSLARLWQQQGKKSKARQIVAETYGWFTEGFDTKDLQEAKALLEELS